MLIKRFTVPLLPRLLPKSSSCATPKCRMASTNVIAGTQKLAGGAQRRGRGGVLHQGSIVGHVDADRLLAGFRSEFGIEFVPYMLTVAEQAEADRLRREKYAPVNSLPVGLPAASNCAGNSFVRFKAGWCFISGPPGPERIVFWQTDAKSPQRTTE